MALVLADRVKETANAPGTGTVTLLGASTGYQSFAVVGNDNTTYYTISDQSGSNWEVGIGTYTSSGTTLARTTVLSSSNAGSLVDFSSGTQDVFVTYPSATAVMTNVAQTLSNKTFSDNPTLSAGTANGVTYLNGSKVLTTGSALTFDGTNFVNGAGGVRAGTNSGGGGGVLSAWGGASGATIDITPNTSSGANGVTYNTSFVSGGSGPHIFSIGGSEQMRLTSTGLGIGTSSPTQKLEVNGNGLFTGGQVVLNANTANYLYFKNASKLVFSDTVGNERMTIDSSGNLGIGTSSPPLKLSVLSNVITNNTSTPVVMLGSDRTDYYASINSVRGSASTYLGLAFSTSNNALPAEAMRLDPAGNLGIGNSSPSYKLDVTGSARITGISSGIVTSASGLLGSVAAPAGTIVGTSDAQTLTNKRIDPRVSTAASTATLAPDISSFDQYNLTAQAEALSVSAPTGTPQDGNKLIIRILDNGTARAITWNATYTAIGVTLPTTTTANKMLYVGCIYNFTNTRWDVIALTVQA
jgi:hypothetical protein